MAAESMTSREKEKDQVLSLMDAARNDNGQDTESRIASLALINDIIVCHRDAFAFEQFVASLPELLHSRSSAVIPKYVVQIIGDLCLRNLDYAGQLCSYLLTSLKDDSPDVVRQAITSGTNLFCCIFQKSGQQLADKRKLDDWLEELLKWALIFKDEVYQIAFQTGLHGVKLLALKFVEITILLFTPDSGGSATSNNQGMSRTFNITYLVGDHPLLDSALLSQEGNKNLDILLEKLHPSGVSALQSSVVIVIINSLAALAKRRLPLYDRIIPVLLGLQRNCNSGKAGQTASVQHALKTALLSCLKCTNEPEASPWRDKIAATLRAMNAGDQADQIIRQLARMLRNSERASRDPRIIKEERTVFPHPYVAGANKKRNAAHDNGTSTDISDMSAKRSRSSQILSEKQHNSVALDALIDNSTSNDVSVGGIVLESELNPVQKMIAMIGALLAEGERGRESLELLISKIQSDLLADIVIANMQFLPKSPPVVLSRFFDAHQAPMSLKTPPVTQIQTQTHTSSVRSLPEESSLQPPASDVCRDPRRDPRRVDPRRMAVPVGVKANSVKVEDFSPPSIISSEKQESAPFEVAPIEVKSEMPTDKQQLEQNQTDNASLLEPTSTEILTRNDENMKNSSASNETCVSSVVVSTNPETGQETSCFSPSTSRSEEIVDDDLPLEAATSSNELRTPPAEEKSFESVTMPTFVVLTDEQKTSIGIEAFTRIVEEQTQGSVEAGRKLRCAVLARLLAEHGAEIDAVRILQKRVVFDYQSNKGHELILHILYHLYAQFYSQPNELQSSSPMAFLYEKILLSVAEALRDNLPASDKSLSRLLGEAPYLPESSLKLLEGLCHPDSSSYEGTDFPTGDRVTQGLGAVWSLILTRPVTRIPCLNIALQCTIHESDEVRAKAVRLVANRLYAIEYLSHDIETFAIKMLLSVVNIDQIYESLQESTDIGSSISDENKRKVASGQETMHEENAVTLAKSSVSDVLKPSQNTQSISVGKAQRYMSLYFALCTKNHALLHQIFNVYGQAPKATKQAIHRHIPSIIRTIGSSSSYILKIVSDPPAGSENLLLQVLHIFTDGKTPSKELISTVKQLYEAKLKDAAILIPMLSSLSKEEVLPIFPRLVDLPLDKFQNALARILQGSVHTGPALTPAEVLIAIHSIDPEKDNIPLKKITDACSACFDQKTVFTQQVLEQVLNHLVQENPLPLLFMRTVIQAIGTFPSLIKAVVGSCEKITKVVYNHNVLLSLFLRQSKGKEIVRPRQTRFATNFLALQRLLEAKVPLEYTFIFEQWTQSDEFQRLSTSSEGMEVAMLVKETVEPLFDNVKEVLMVDFVMRILSQLIKKQIWKLPKLWVGFLKCAYQTKPHSFHVLLQLPAPILENALNKHPTLRGPLASHASQVNIRTTVPRSTLVVLGLAQENQPVTTTSLTTVSASSDK